MLMQPADREAYAAIVSGWRALGGAPAAWRAVDRGILTDPAVLPGANDDLERARTMAQQRHAGGDDDGFLASLQKSASDAYDTATKSAQDTATQVAKTATDAYDAATKSAQDTATQVAKTVEDTAGQLAKMTSDARDAFCKENPKTCKALDPASSWCQRLDFPDAICDENGIKSWFWWTLGLSGVALLGGTVYLSYRASKIVAPIALAAYAPEALPLYQALQHGDQQAMQEQAIQAARAFGEQQRAAAPAAVPAASPVVVQVPPVAFPLTKRSA